MAHRIFDVKIVKVDVRKKILVVEEKTGKKIKKIVFRTVQETLITDKHSNVLNMLELKIGKRVIIDFFINKSETLVARGVMLL